MPDLKACVYFGKIERNLDCYHYLFFVKEVKSIPEEFNVINF
jgi:hypothetical protein